MGVILATDQSISDPGHQPTFFKKVNVVTAFKVSLSSTTPVNSFNLLRHSTLRTFLILFAQPFDLIHPRTALLLCQGRQYLILRCSLNHIVSPTTAVHLIRWLAT